MTSIYMYSTTQLVPGMLYLYVETLNEHISSHLSKWFLSSVTCGVFYLVWIELKALCILTALTYADSENFRRRGPNSQKGTDGKSQHGKN